MNIKLNLLILILFSGMQLMAQKADNHDDTHDHSHEHSDEHHHHHHKNEIGIAISPVYFVEEKEFSYGLHLHFIRRIKESKFGVGIGVERLFDDHKHNTIGIIGSYSPFDGFTINLSPGITFEDEHSSELNFASHVEVSYELEVNNFHLGPVLELAVDSEDVHLSLGVHIGIGF